MLFTIMRLQTELSLNPQSSLPSMQMKYCQKIMVQYVENESMELGYQSECREKVQKVKGTWEVQIV